MDGLEPGVYGMKLTGMPGTFNSINTQKGITNGKGWMIAQFEYLMVYFMQR